jgi:carbon-monoxide dehydrogenase medium subunit
MIPSKFDYAKPASLAEAFALLGEHNGDAKILAGGHSLIPMMKLRLAEPAFLVDLAGIPDLTGIAFDGKRFTIGAMTRHAALAANADLKTHAPVLWDAANVLGDPQVRNRGTIGGALANGDPACDYAAVAFALDATFTIAGKDGTREESAAGFMTGMFETSLAPHEVLVSISFDAAPQSAYAKYHHPASHYAIVGAAAVLSLAGGKISEARIGVTGVGDHAYRAGAIEKALTGIDSSDAGAIKTAVAGSSAGQDVRSDTQASAEYRAAMSDAYVRRAVVAAAARA